MYCQNRIVYTVQAGDSLYKLSRQYKTTVTELILGNPGVNPYNLQIGMRLTICPGAEYEPEDGVQIRPIVVTPGGMSNMPSMPGTMRPGMPEMNRPNTETPSMPEMPGQTGTTRPNMPEMNRPNTGTPSMPEMPGENQPNDSRPETNENETQNEVENLMEDMRVAWLEHVFWTRMYLMSVTSDAGDQQQIAEQLLENVDEITDVFARFLPIGTTRQLRNLLADHVELAGEIIRTLNSDDQEDYENLIREWYGNANQIATLLGGINPFFNSRETRNLLLNHLDMTRAEIEQQINGEYAQSLDTFRDIRKQALEMADFFARGLLAR